MSDLSFWDAAEKHFNLAVRPMMKRARQEIEDELLSGLTVQSHTLEDVIDTALQDEGRYKEFLSLVSALVAANHSGSVFAKEEVSRCMQIFLQRRVEEYVTEDMVRERAEHLAECEEENERSHQGE